VHLCPSVAQPGPLRGSARQPAKTAPRVQAVPQPYEQVSFQHDGVEFARFHFGAARKTVRDLCLEKMKAGTLKKKDSSEVVTEAELNKALDPRRMTEPAV
jgi:hypothetical protein